MLVIVYDTAGTNAGSDWRSAAPPVDQAAGNVMPPGEIADPRTRLEHGCQDSLALLIAPAPQRLGPASIVTCAMIVRAGQGPRHRPRRHLRPVSPNDRLLLGMKESISEFELGVLRSRMLIT